MYLGCHYTGININDGGNKLIATMETCCSKFTAAEGGARLAAAAAERNTLAVEYAAFVATRLLHEDAYKIRGLFSKGYKRSVYVTRASKVACVAYELHILTDLTTVQALEHADVEDWKEELEEKQVIVCTSQVLKWLLQESVLTIPLLNVLIIDSCHLIFEDQNLQYVMKCYKTFKESEQPRILALTYPLFTSGKDFDVATNNTSNDSQQIINLEMTASSVNEMANNYKNAETAFIIEKVENDKIIDKSESKNNENKIEDADDKCDMKVELCHEIDDEEAVSFEIDHRIIEITEESENSLQSKSNGIELEINSEVHELNQEDTKMGNDKLSIIEKDSLENTTIIEKHTSEQENKVTDNAADVVNTENTVEKTDTQVEIVKCNKHDKGDDFQMGVQENLDDFEMYEKLEWKIEELEEALCCKMDLAEDIDGGKRLSNTIAKPKEILIEYSPQPPLQTMPDAYVELVTYMRDAVASAKAFMDEHRYDPTEIYGDDLYEEFMNIPDPTIEPKLMFNQFLYVLDQLGPYAADKAAFSLLVKLEKLKIKVPYERHFLLLCLCTSVFIKIRCQADLILSKYEDWERIFLFSTPKVLRFAEILEQFQSPEQKEKTVDSLKNYKNIEINETFVDGDVNTNLRNDIFFSKYKDLANTKTQNQINSIDRNVDNGNQTETDIVASKPFSKTGFETSSSKGDKSEDPFSDLNSPENLGRVEFLEEVNKSCSENQSYSSTQSNIDTDSDNTHKGKLVRSKTTELIDELDKCDFVTLGNKIEDRVNTYEANLKDLDDFNTDSNNKLSTDVDNKSYRVYNKSKKDDETHAKSNVTIVNNDDVQGLKDNKGSVKIDKDDNKYNHQAHTEMMKKTDIKSNDKANKNNNIQTMEEPNNVSIKQELKSNADNMEIKESKGLFKHQKYVNPLDHKQLRPIDVAMDLKPKLGLRRLHRVRSRGRLHRTNAARLQQMQQNPDALCGIVFVKEPLVAKIMFMIIADMSRCRSSLSHLCAQYCAVESEGDDCRPRGKKHEEVLKKFRMHECNLLLATSALEEGIDLPRCNLVVRWDTPPSYRSHGLCRSRARAQRSSVALMGEAPSEGLLNNLSVYKELDQIISRKCGCGVQKEPPPSEEVYADLFTPAVKAYIPDEDKEINKQTDHSISAIDRNALNSDKKETQISGVKEAIQRDVINIDNDKNCWESDSNKVADVCEILITDVNNRMDNQSKSIEEHVNKKNELYFDIINEDDVNLVSNDFKCIDANAKEAVNTKGDINRIDDIDKLIDIKSKFNETVTTENHVKSNDRTNGTLSVIDEIIVNKHENNFNKCEISERTNIPTNNNNKTRDSYLSTETNFNVTYNFNKSVCVCKSSLCKCKSVNVSTNEMKNKAKGDDELCSVDLSTAIALINRYCSKLPSDTFTRLAPQYWMEEVQLPDKRTGELRTAYICTLRLPLNCPVKYNIVGHPMPTEVLARRMVALQACRILHKSGELDNQLMPIGKENFKAAELENIVQSEGENNDSARPGTTKRRQYYYKRTASAFTDCQPIIDSSDADIEQHAWRDVQNSYKARFGPECVHNTLYALSSRLWCALPERYNTRGRRLHAPQHAPHAVAVLMAARDKHGLHIPAFPVYTRSGEVRVSIERAPHADVRLSPGRARLVRRFMRFVFSEVLRVRRRGMRLQTEGSTHNNYYIVPTVRVAAEDGSSYVDIDWSFLELIYKHTEEKKNTIEKPVLLQQDEEEEEEVVEKKPKREKEKDGKVKKMENPLLRPGEVFVFDADRYRDAVVTPWYRNRDQPQYFLVAEICWNLTPDSAFPSSSHGSFRDYYSGKYGVTLTQSHQPLLDVDHTSARLNLLTPRYVNRKGVALPVSSERTRRAKRDRLDQKQILVPELCTVHPFAAPLWFATVALPCVLYRINALLIADEIRRSVGVDVALGAAAARGAPPPHWPPLDFGWSLAEVLNTEEKCEKSDKKREDEDSRRGEKELKEKEEKESFKEEKDAEQKTGEMREKTINDILQEKEDAESGFEIGTWSNDMASSIPAAEYDEFLEPLPPNLTFCTSASGGTNWAEPLEKSKMTYGASKTFSMAESDCSYMSSDFDTDDSDLNSEGSDEETDSSGFCSKNSYAAMGVRIEYKTAHEAEAVDLERKARVSSAPQPDPLDDERDVAAQKRILRDGQAPKEYIEKYKKSIAKHKHDIRIGNVVTKDKPIKEILPDTTKEMEKLRKCLELKLNNNKIENAKTNEEDVKGGMDVIIEAANTNDIAILNGNDCDKINSKLAIDNKRELNLATESNKTVTELEVNVNLDKKLDDDFKIGNDVLGRKNILNRELIRNITSHKELVDITKTDSNSDNKTALNNDFRNKELLEAVFPYGDALDVINGEVTLESIEKNKRVILNELKKTLSKEEVNKMNCFSMLDIDIDSPNYVNDKIVNVGFDTKDSYTDKVNGFRNPKEYSPYFEDGKGQNGKDFDFDYQPDLENHPGPSPSVILQALTMSNANDGINLERLETIGDSFLKFAITAYLYCAHPAVHEGKLSHMRSKQVSNLNLYRLGRNKRLGARMIASKFEPHDNWLPPCHKPPPTHHPTSNIGDQEAHMQKEVATDNTGCFIPYNLITQHSIPDKSIADCVEALIGAYLLEMGPRGALLFMSWLGISVLPRHVVPLPADHPYVRATVAEAEQQKPTSAPSPKKSYSSSSISCSTDSEEQSSDDEEGSEDLEQSWDCEWSWQGRPVGSLRPRMDEHGNWTQTVYGELRAPPSPLLRYVEDPEGELERMLSGYEALERTLQYRFRDRSLLLQALTHASHHQNRLTDCYQRLEFLGDAILDYLITRHLYEDARRHSPGALTDLRSALVNNTIFATLAARHGFHKYFRHMSPGLNEVLTKYVKIQEENGHSISEEHYLIQEDELEQAEDVEVPKALGDLFESVAGAIFLDSGMSLGAVWGSYVRLMGAELDAFSAAAPKSPVRELLEAEPDTAKFGKPERLADGRRVRVCVEVFGRGAFKGIGRNYRIAKGTAARCALRHLRGTRPPRR